MTWLLSLEGIPSNPTTLPLDWQEATILESKSITVWTFTVSLRTSRKKLNDIRRGSASNELNTRLFWRAGNFCPLARAVLGFSKQMGSVSSLEPVQHM